MLISRVAYRFAKALLQLAIERDELDVVLKDIQLVYSTCDENRDFRMMLESPVIKVDKKRKIFHIVFEERLSEISIKFFDIIFRRSREELIMDIAQSFISQYKVFKKIHLVTVETAEPLDEENRKRIVGYLNAKTDDSLELIEKVNKELIGGIILRMNDLQIDASVRNNLNKLEKRFSKDLFSTKI